MTVGELILLLQAYDLDKDVVLDTREWEHVRYRSLMAGDAVVRTYVDEDGAVRISSRQATTDYEE